MTLLDYHPTDDDGYTLPCYIAPKPRMHNAVRFAYRPTRIVDRATLIEVNGNVAEKAFSLYLAEWMAKRIVSWSLKQVGPDGMMVPMPITPANLLTLKSPLWLRLINIVVWGSDAGDEDPERSKQENLSQAEIELQAALEKANLMDLQLRELEKNS